MWLPQSNLSQINYLYLDFVNHELRRLSTQSDLSLTLSFLAFYRVERDW